MKQIRSGQSFLYRTNGYDSTVVEIRMHDKVTGSYLQVALTNTARRFPYLTQKLVEKGGAYYLHRDDNSMVAVKTDKFRTLGSMATGYHLLDVTYIGNCIRVAFHHGLCDGRGVMPFIETLLYDYCCQKYHKKFSSEGIRLPGEPIPEKETVEPFTREFYEVDETAVQQVEHDGFALPESTSVPEGCYHSEILLDENTFVQAARAIGATPTLLAAMLLSRCILELNPQAEKPVVCNLAMDLRSAIGKELTHRNCVGTAYLPYTAQDKTSAPDIASLKIPNRSFPFSAPHTAAATAQAADMEMRLPWVGMQMTFAISMVFSMSPFPKQATGPIFIAPPFEALMLSFTGSKPLLSLSIPFRRLMNFLDVGPTNCSKNLSFFDHSISAPSATFRFTRQSERRIS